MRTISVKAICHYNNVGFAKPHDKIEPPWIHNGHSVWQPTHQYRLPTEIDFVNVMPVPKPATFMIAFKLK